MNKLLPVSINVSLPDETLDYKDEPFYFLCKYTVFRDYSMIEYDHRLLNKLVSLHRNKIYE